MTIGHHQKKIILKTFPLFQKHPRNIPYLQNRTILQILPHHHWPRFIHFHSKLTNSQIQIQFQFQFPIFSNPNSSSWKWEKSCTSREGNAGTRSERSSGRWYATSTASTTPESTVATLNSNWNASMFITTKRVAEGTFHAPSSWI